jgi:hypothetical protein
MVWGIAVSGEPAAVGCRLRYLLGWKAMPLALEDLDSNYNSVSKRKASRWRSVVYLCQHGRGRHGGGREGYAAPGAP